MPATYVNIASQTLGSSTASVTFSSIPNTYTDLVIRCSTRTTQGSAADAIVMQINNDTGSNYSTTWIEGRATTPISTRLSNETTTWVGRTEGDTATASTFGSTEIYIPNYTASINKPISSNAVAEQNATTNWYINGIAGLWRNTATISSIKLTPSFGQFIAGSSFYLYGIKNS